MRIDLFLFDLAGTTIVDGGWVLDAFRQVATRNGIDTDDEWLRARMGRSKRSVFEELVRSVGREDLSPGAMVEDFDRHVTRMIAAGGVTAFPSARTAITGLQEMSVAVGFTTGFGRATALAVVRAAGFPDEIVVGSDEVACARPAPDLIHEGMRRARVADAARVGVAGDTPADLWAGTAACCGLVVAVGHGSHTLGELAGAPHTHALDDLDALPQLVRSVGASAS